MKYTYSSKELSGAEESPKGGQLRPVRKSSGSRYVWIVVFAVVGLCAAGGWWLSGRSKKPLSALPVAGQADKPALSDGAAQKKASDKDIVLYLESTEAEVRQLFELVRQSAFVQENAQYRSLMKEVGFVYASTNDDVNAVASRMVGKDGKETRLITCYAGEMRFAKTIALAAAAELSGRKGSVHAMMEKMSPVQCVRLGLNDAAVLLRECGLDSYLLDESIRVKAKSIGSGSVLGVLAHEVGHQVLGHNYQSGKAVLNTEVLRNFESQADLFASSVMSSSPFGEYVFAGRLFALWVRMRQTDPILRKLPAGKLDHPLDKERFMALLLANKEKAAALGIKVPE
jgi:hypothetical protein